MPNDAVLDPTVHHLFAKDRFNRGKSSRSWPLHPRCGHDLSPPLCPPFLEAGTPDLLWLYKSQRKAWKKGEKDFGRRKNPEKQRRNQENASHTQSKNPDPNSKGEASTVLCSSSQGLISRQRRRKRQRRVTDQPCHCLRPCRKRTTKNQRLLTTGITIVYFPSSQNQRRQNAIKERSRRKEHKQRKVTETIATAFGVATTFGVSRTRRESKGRQKEGTRRCLTSALITRSFVFVVKHTRPGKFILSHSAI
jgi:hypothetical protein